MSSHVALNRVLCWFLDVSRNLVFFPWRCKSCFQRSSARKCQKTWQLLLRFSKLDSFCLLEIGSASNLRKKAQKQKRERKKLWSHFVCKRNFLTLLIIFLNGVIFIYYRRVHFHSLNNPCLAIMGLALDLIVLKSLLRLQTVSGYWNELFYSSHLGSYFITSVHLTLGCLIGAQIAPGKFPNVEEKARSPQR